MPPKEVSEVIFHLRDINQAMTNAWEKEFAPYSNTVKVSCGDIFKGAPAVDAIVSPANSFGFMDGGIDMVYINHFGWQMQHRLQAVIRVDYDGEIPVGQAAIIETLPPDDSDENFKDPQFNEGKLIKYLISAPTMRVPMDVIHSVNAYLAFRAVIRAVKDHNRTVENPEDQINTVLCPGLGTAVGRMPTRRAAFQMRQAFEICALGKESPLTNPDCLSAVCNHHEAMLCY
ncbi:hypothetical protein ABFA07_010600 [Porites harrisoni]